MPACDDDFGYCHYCARFFPEAGDEQCRRSRALLAQKIERELELRTPQPSHAFGILFAIVVALLAGCAMG